MNKISLQILNKTKKGLFDFKSLKVKVYISLINSNLVYKNFWNFLSSVNFLKSHV